LIILNIIDKMIEPEKRSIIMRFIQNNMAKTTPAHIIAKIEERLYNMANGDYTAYCDITTIRQRIQTVLEIFNERQKASTKRGLATRFDKSKKASTGQKLATQASPKRKLATQSEQSKQKKTNCGQIYIELLDISIFDDEEAASALMSMGTT
jgi:hypothetical protein